MSAVAVLLVALGVADLSRRATPAVWPPWVHPEASTTPFWIVTW